MAAMRAIFCDLTIARKARSYNQCRGQRIPGQQGATDAAGVAAHTQQWGQAFVICSCCFAVQCGFQPSMRLFYVFHCTTGGVFTQQRGGSSADRAGFAFKGGIAYDFVLDLQEQDDTVTTHGIELLVSMGFPDDFAAPGRLLCVLHNGCTVESCQLVF